MIEMKKKITNIIQTSAPILNRISVESGSEGILFANQLAIIKPLVWSIESFIFFSPLPSSPLFLHGRRKKGGEPIEGGSDGNKACLDKTIVRLDYPAGDTRMSLSSSGSRPYVEENSRFEPRLGRIMVEVGSEDTRPVHRPVLDLW